MPLVFSLYDATKKEAFRVYCGKASFYSLLLLNHLHNPVE